MITKMLLAMVSGWWDVRGALLSIFLYYLNMRKSVSFMSSEKSTKHFHHGIKSPPLAVSVGAPFLH